MVSFPALRSTLMALLLASPVFLMPTTPNDPFHALAAHAPKHPELPVCCLTPLSPMEPVVEDDVLLTFEEWKAKQFTMQAEAKAKAKDTSRSVAAASQTHATGGSNQSEHLSEADAPASADSPSSESEENAATKLLSPHFRVPLTDRFNYASLDCSARVHTAHRSAKSPSSILSSKKDRYMLSPCSSSKDQAQYVVVELCEDIRIDTVQLANFEFFSGVFKDFTVSVAKTYTTDTEGWTVAGTYKAKNVRGVQSFHPPTSLRDFYRYIRIDFHSHYGNEYYCPVSLLRVYGLTHLEQWKWDIWEAESRAKQDELQEAKEISSPVNVNDAFEPALMSTADTGKPETATIYSAGADTARYSLPENLTKEEAELSVGSLEDAAGIPSTPSITTGAQVEHQNPVADHTPLATTASTSAPSATFESSISKRSISTPDVSASTKSVVHEMSRQAITADSSSDIVPLSTPTTDTSSIPHLTNASWDPHLPPSYENATTVNSFRISSGIPSQTTATIPLPQPPVAATATGGESIYRTIMNRLTALEANHTLYARYVEEQTAGVRDMLKRLGEEVGRLEGIGKAQAQMYQRTVIEWERQRNRLEMEHGELMSRVDYLSDEIVLEKRLGIAQLCLLLAVLVFMGLTRGSRGEVLLEHGQAPVNLNKSMREWSRRHLSFSSDWANRFRSRSPTPQPVMRSPIFGKDRVEFPKSKPQLPPFTSRTPLHAEQAMQIKQMQAFANERRPATAGIITSVGKRSRTPTSLRTPTRHLNGHHLRPLSPTGAHNIASPPLIQRANSHGGPGTSSGFSGIGPVPRSARKWARTAHLHEVRGRDDKEKHVRGRDHGGGENDTRDVFQSPASPYKGYSSSQHISVGDTFKLIDKKSPQVFPTHLTPLPARRPKDADNSTDNDLWVDTDVDGSEIDFNSESDVQYSPKSGATSS